MKKMVFFISLVTIGMSCFAQSLEFPAKDIDSLFGNSPVRIKSYLNNKGYFFKKKEDAFNFYLNGEKEIRVCYKNAGMSLFSFTIPFSDINLIHSELLMNGYTNVETKILDDNGDFIASFNNADNIHMCSLIRSPYNPDFIFVSFSNRK